MFDRWFDSHRWWWCILSGLLLNAAFAPFSSATCGWIALVPAWWILTRSARVRLHPFRHGYLVGLVYFGGVFWWISDVTAVGTGGLILYLALFPACWFLLVERFVLRRSGEGTALFRAFAAAALWVTLEWWRSWFLTGFNWNELGISQAPSIIFRQLAAFGGVHLISFVLVLVNVLWAEGLLAIAQTAREKRIVRPSLPFAAALVTVAVCFALGWHQLQRHKSDTPSPALTFACIQSNVPQIPPGSGETRAEYFRRQDEAIERTFRLSAQALNGPAKPQLLIWPEATTGKAIFDSDHALYGIVQEISRAFDGGFLLGSEYFDPRTGKIYNSAFLFTAHGDDFVRYGKTQLVILGEYIPFGDTFPWLHKAIGIGMDFSRGPGPEKFQLTPTGSSFSPLICFEDTLTDVTRQAARLKPDFFVNITNDGWYTGWCAAWGVRQHVAQAVFRCVETDRPMIRCANTGISCIVDQNGTVIDRYHDSTGREIDIGGVYTGSLIFYPAHLTLYEAWGDWIVLISLAVTAILGVRFLFAPKT